MCQTQAAGLHALKNEYRRFGKNDIQFILVNMKGAESFIGELSQRAPSFPVYQDSDQRGIWTKLNGDKDDVLIYDRCGKLTYFVPFPSSLLHYGIVRWAIDATYNNNYCSCPLHEQVSRPRRSLHNRNQINSINQHRRNRGSSVISMDGQGDRDINRTPKCFSRNCRRNRHHHRHRLVHRL